MTAAKLVELWRGGLMESRHLGHVVIADTGGIVEAWGNPGAVWHWSAPRWAFVRSS